MRICLCCTLMLPAAILQLSGCSYDATPDPAATASTESTAPAPAMPVEETASPESDDDMATVAAEEEDVVPMELESDEADVPLLTISDVAPPIAIAKWVKGDPISTFEDGNVYVVEFWATWCGPCRTSMPHISQLQDEYGERVLFMGISDETEDVVQGFLAGMQNEENNVTWDEAITYRIALDQDQQTSTNYMRAARQNGIPTAFIVGKDGHVEWIGHPMSMDQPLAEVVSGSWDREAAREQFELAAKAERLQQEIMPKLNKAFGEEDWETALQLVQSLEEQVPDDLRILQIKMVILERAGRTDELAQAQSSLVDAVWEQAQALNQVAWTLVNRPGAQNLDLAMKAATRANELNGGQDGATLATLARVHYSLGDLDKAIELQKKAVELESIEPIKESLAQYEAEKAGATDGDGDEVELPSVPAEEAVDE